MALVEFVGGPYDGSLRAYADEELFGVLEFTEPRNDVRPLGDRLAAGEVIPAIEAEEPTFIVHRYSRSEPPEWRGRARVYRYVRPAG